MTTRIFTTGPEPKRLQIELLDDDTYNFLCELNIVCYGIYINLIGFAVQDPSRVYQTILSVKKSWPHYFAHLKVNPFQIVMAVRKGALPLNHF